MLFSSMFQSLFALFLRHKKPGNGLYTKYIKKVLAYARTIFFWQMEYRNIANNSVIATS